MNKIIAAICLLLTASFLMFACNDAPDEAKSQPVATGRINISVDETFKPVIEEQIKVFESSYPLAEINVSYKSEADCFRDLQQDSTRMIVVARGLTGDETRFYRNKLNYDPRYDLLAFDAIAVVVNKTSNDTVFTMKQLSSYLRGEADRQIVLDGKNATSTVRYLIDSVVRGAEFGKNVVAAENSEGVLDAVASNKNAIGMVGISWIGDETNSKQREYLKKVKLAFLECKVCVEEAFYKPTTVSIAEGKYPFYRPMFFILKENTPGLGTEFMAFMKFERGQLIFKRSRLIPGKMRLQSRATEINESE